MASWRGGQRAAVAAAAGAAVGLLGGLIGLGGAEFRLPLLVRGFRLDLRTAIRFNLVMSLVTVVAALIIRFLARGATGPPSSLFLVIAGVAIGGMAGALIGSYLLQRVSDSILRRTIQVLLAALGILLLAEAVIDWGPASMLGGPVWRAGVALVAGMPIGAVSSLLGVAGGELIIPTLVFVFGAEIKAAGTASLMISIPTLLVGLCRPVHRSRSIIRSELLPLVLPMAGGSVLGATVGGFLASAVSSAAIKIVLGLVLVWSALRMFHESRDAARA